MSYNTAWIGDGGAVESVPQVDYGAFIDRKSQLGNAGGFEPVFVPDFLFPFQAHLVEWAVRHGRGALFADCGLGKGPMALVWAENVVRHTNGRVLLLTPLAVGAQMVTEGEKFGVDCARSRDGSLPESRIVVTNYQQLHKFDPNDFTGIVCDESSVLKHFTGSTQKNVTRFAAKLPYRLLCTATAAPNDYTELGTSAEALGVMGHTDMLGRFFRPTDNARPARIEDVKRTSRTGRDGGANHFAKLAYRVSQDIGKWRMKGHAVVPFWRWVSSWARACRKPSDLGFDDTGFILPDLIEHDVVVVPERPAEGMLFVQPAFGLREEREERKRTLVERCERAAALVDHNRPAVVWCHYNDEGDALEKMIPGAVQVAGRHSDDEKEEAYQAFGGGEIRVLVTKPKIGAWGLNWQHCRDVVTFATHSFEQEYQAIRRCWRFGQEHPVTVHRISSEGEAYLRQNLARKRKAADEMFDAIIRFMHDAQAVEMKHQGDQQPEVPSWLSLTSA